MKILSLLKKPLERDAKKIERGFLVFDSTTEVIRAQDLLKKSGLETRVMGPPPEIQTGCDMVIEYLLTDSLNILRILEEDETRPKLSLPVSGGMSKPVDIFSTTDFGAHLMVKAANMKITIDKKTLIIVNISGGGCPDVPYLAHEMTGRRLGEAPMPKTLGHTLCAYALQLACEEMKRTCSLS